MTELKRVVWKNKKGRVVGVDLVECGSEMFDIVNKIRTIYEGKNAQGVFLLGGISKNNKAWSYGVYNECSLFYNKIVLKCPLQYEYVYSFITGKIYKVVV